MKAKAAALGKPLVVNLSLGSYFGARDGTSNFEQGLSNLSGPGVILVGAAGNEGNAKLRATGTLTQGESVAVGFTVPLEQRSGQGRQARDLVSGRRRLRRERDRPQLRADECGGRRRTPELPTRPAVAWRSFRPRRSRTTTTGRFASTSGSTAAAPLAAGAWTVTLVGTTVAGGSRPFSIISGEDANDWTFTTHTAPVTTEILTNVASAKRVIGVASYNTRFSWNSLAGPIANDNMFGPLSDISDFSSRGPRRNCSNAAKCPPVMKPEITAPGAMIGAAYASDINAANASAQTRIEADGVHTFYNGTSMATPHVSGAVALMLQVNPTLTPEAAKATLATSRQTNAFSTNLPTYDAAAPDTPANPNYTWGYGILDAAAAVRSLQPAGTPINVIEYYHAGFDHYFITWVAAEIANLDSGATKGWTRTGQSFKVYTAAQGGNVGRVPDLHSAGQGRRPLLRPRHERMRRHDEQEPDVHPRVAHVLLSLPAEPRQLRRQARCRSIGCSATAPTRITATRPTARRATRWSPRAGLRRVTAPIPS